MKMNMKLTSVAVVIVLLSALFSTSFATVNQALDKLRCKNSWDCKRCAVVKREGKCNGPYMLGTCYKTCTGCDKYVDERHDCASIKAQGKCFSPTTNNKYIVYAQKCEASCCQAYPLSFPSATAPSITTPSTTSPPTTLSTTPPRIYWNLWSPWSVCSKTCRGGYRKRTRTCFSRDKSIGCTRPQSQHQYCNENVNCGALDKLRCKNNWNCKRCDEVKRQGKCNGPYMKGVCFKTCTGCDKYVDQRHDCASIKAQGKCFSATTKNKYIVYAQKCEASCCQAYPLSFPWTTAPSLTTPSTTSPPTSPPPRIYWNQWSPWSVCSKTCYIGYRKRTRTCSSLDTSVDCTKLQNKYEYCNQNVSCM